MSATDQQMQNFCDQRIRPDAELIRQLINRLRDSKSEIDDEYARATSNSAWVDNREDPPHKLQSGNNANPDDLLNYNAFATALLAIFDGTGDAAANAAAVRSSWPVLERACVRPV